MYCVCGGRGLLHAARKIAQAAAAVKVLPTVLTAATVMVLRTILVAAVTVLQTLPAAALFGLETVPLCEITLLKKNFSEEITFPKRLYF